MRGVAVSRLQLGVGVMRLVTTSVTVALINVIGALAHDVSCRMFLVRGVAVSRHRPDAGVTRNVIPLVTVALTNVIGVLVRCANPVK